MSKLKTTITILTLLVSFGLLAHGVHAQILPGLPGGPNQPGTPGNPPNPPQPQLPAQPVLPPLPQQPGATATPTPATPPSSNGGGSSGGGSSDGGGGGSSSGGSGSVLGLSKTSGENTSTLGLVFLGTISLALAAKVLVYGKR